MHVHEFDAYLDSTGARRVDFPEDWGHPAGIVWWFSECLTDPANGGSCCRVVKQHERYMFYCHCGQIAREVTLDDFKKG